MTVDVLNNVHIDILDGETREVKKSVSTHNKANRNMVRGIINFLEGNLSPDADEPKQYIPCYIGFGHGGVVDDSDKDNPIFDSSWNDTVDYYSTDLVNEFPNSRSRIRKQENTFQYSSDLDEYPSTGSMDSIILYSEISPNILNQRLKHTEETVIEVKSHREQSVSSSGNYIISMSWHIIFPPPPSDQRGRIEKNTIRNFVISIPYSFGYGYSFTISFNDDGNGNLVCTEVPSYVTSLNLNVGDIIGAVNYNNGYFTFTHEVVQDRGSDHASMWSGTYYVEFYESKTITTYSDSSFLITEFGLFPDDNSTGTMLAHVKLSNKYENISPDTVIKTVNISNSEYSTNTSGELVLVFEDVEHCSPILKRGSISGNVEFTNNDVEMYVPFIDDSNGNLICTESVIDASTSTVFATSGEIIGTVDYSLAKILLDTSKPYINRSEEWVYTDAYDTHDNRSGLSWYGNRIIVPQPSLKPGVKSVIQLGENTISYQLPYGAFPGTYSMTFIAKDDGNGNLLCTTEVSYGSTVYIPVGTVIGTLNYTTGMATILPEYCTDIGPNHIDITDRTVSISYLRKYYVLTFMGYNGGNINFKYDIVAYESFTRCISGPIRLHPNDLLSLTWSITVAAIGEDDAFYNSNVYDEFGNPNPVENTYVKTYGPLSNIIVLTDSN